MKAATETPLEQDPAVASSLTPGPNFDRLAPVYRWMEALTFGPWLWWCRCAFLREMRGARRALVLGDGDGRFTARLLRDDPTVTVDAVDISPAMLRALLKRAGKHAGRVRTTVSDLRSWLPDEVEYDLVVTHFFLDCLTMEEVEVLARKVRPYLAPRALWVVSEFAVPETWFGRLLARPLVRLLYWAFGWLTGLAVRRLPDYACALRRTGFELQNRKVWWAGLLVSEVWCDAGWEQLEKC